MNQLLLCIPGVQHGCFFMPTAQEVSPGASSQIQRPCAFVVAPGLDANTIRQQLRQQVDPMFLPRPVWFVVQLPRNSASKLPRAALLALYQQLSTKPSAAEPAPDAHSWYLDPELEVFEGHFPAHPVLPGALLLDWVIGGIQQQLGRDVEAVAQVKFLQAAEPGDRLQLSLQADGDRVRFEVSASRAPATSRTVASGVASLVRAVADGAAL